MQTCLPWFHRDTASKDYDGGLTVVCASGRCRRSLYLWSLRRARPLRRCRRSSGALTTSSRCAARRCAALDGLEAVWCVLGSNWGASVHAICLCIMLLFIACKFVLLRLFYPSAVRDTARVSSSMHLAHLLFKSNCATCTVVDTYSASSDVEEHVGINMLWCSCAKRWPARSACRSGSASTFSTATCTSRSLASSRLPVRFQQVWQRRTRACRSPHPSAERGKAQGRSCGTPISVSSSWCDSMGYTALSIRAGVWHQMLEQASNKRCMPGLRSHGAGQPVRA